MTNLDVDDSDCDSFSEKSSNPRLSSGTQHTSRRARWPMIHYFVVGCCLMTTLGVLIYTTTTTKPSNIYASAISASTTSTVDLNKDVLKSPCGASFGEAKALGCHFDIISFSWLPERCYDAELSQKFDKLAVWEWYIDHNKTQPVAKSEALTGELDGLYVNWEYHVQHCVYMWEKMHRALLGDGKRAVDSYIGIYAHTQHCGKMLLSRGEGFELSNFNTRIRVKYPDCGIE
jgi:hypothetical protein